MCSNCKCRTCSRRNSCSNDKVNSNENYCHFCKGNKTIEICIIYSERRILDEKYIRRFKQSLIRTIRKT